MKSKNTIIAVFAVISILVLGAGVTYYILIQNPSVRFLLTNSGFRTASRYTKKEIFIDTNGKKIPVIMYRHESAKPGKYYMLQHGLTPLGCRHPEIDRLAASICDATGMTVFIPCIEGGIEEGSLNKTYRNMADIYTTLNRTYPGTYRAFGACVGANILLVALNRVPDKIYPEKIFMLGPFFDGRTLFEFYNNHASPEDIDFMVKLAGSLNASNFSRTEKNLICRAIAESKPGITDRNEMRKILGEKLFTAVSTTTLHYKDIEDIGPKTMFGSNMKRCGFFIIHSKSDNIIPYTIGKSLADFMIQNGMKVTFLGTENINHSSAKISLTGFIREIRNLIRFFDALFEGDTNT